MKRLAPLILAVPLLLAGCNNTTPEVTNEPSTSSTSESARSTTKTAELKDLSEGVEGQVGFRHGLDCSAVDECSLNFTVEELEVIDQCDDYVMSSEDRLEGTHLVKATVLVETTDLGTGYAAGEFPIWADWSALTEDGTNVPLSSSAWCYNDNSQQWQEQLHLGDTERRVHYMDVPDGATKIRLTETLTSARWEFPAPEAAGEESSPTPNSDHAAAPAPQPQAAAITSAAPAPAPTPAPGSAPVVGFTGAPSVETPRVLDKQIASCGDPTIHQTGTTFFTDGTSGWTETCSSQMKQ